jgi:hypothetical protein
MSDYSELLRDCVISVDAKMLLGWGVYSDN